MQQTILAILALLIVANFTLNQNRDVVKTYNELVDDELEIAASSVGMHILELISDRSFDNRTRPAQMKSIGISIATNDLTSVSAFGSAAECDLDEPFKDYTPCLDVDDVHMADDVWQTVPFRLRDGKELPFDVQVQVSYVNAVDLDAPLPPGQTSLHKKVTVKIRSKHHVQQGRYLDGFVHIERIFSYDAKRAENRLREKYGVPGVDPVLDPAFDPVVDPVADSVADPAVSVTLCHRAVEAGDVVWNTTAVEEKFVSKHIGHGDTLGAC